MACTLKIVTVNDVYEIDNLPSFKTCCDEEKASGSAHKVISTLPGDFVAPSLLSSLDRGQSMVACMNACGIDYVCIGNHESDVPLAALHSRMRESKFQWINSNMPEFPLPEDIEPMKPYHIVEVDGPGGHSRRVALIGLCCEDRSVMKKGAFGDCEIQPVLESGEHWYKHIMATEKVDAVVPLTHQLIQFDRDMAKQRIGYPIIIGGHDHEAYNEEYAGCKVLKMGMDAKVIGVVELTWADEEATVPKVIITEKPAKNFAKDEETQACVMQSKTIIEEIERSKLCCIPQDGPVFSSVGIRLSPVTVGTFICTTIRKALETDAVVCGSGSIRAGKSYLNQTFFSYADLKAEMPFETAMSIINLPGQVLAEMITYTRAFALQTPPVAKGGYLQSDDGITWDSDTNTVTKIAGEAIVFDKLYRVAINHGMLQGLDDVQPLIKWITTQPKDDTNAHPDEECAIEAKHCIVEYFSRSMMYNMLHRCNGKMEAIDTDNSGTVTKEELRAFLLVEMDDDQNKKNLTNALLNNLFNSLDKDQDGVIVLAEITDLFRTHITEMIFDRSSNQHVHVNDALADMRKMTTNLDESFTEGLISSFTEALKIMDHDGDKYVSRGEYNSFLQDNGDRLKAATAHNINI